MNSSLQLKKNLLYWFLILLIGVWEMTGQEETTVSLNQLGYTVDRWNIDDGLPSSTVFSIAQTEEGFIWAFTRDGLARFDGIQFQPVDVSPQFPNGASWLNDTVVDKEGRLWNIGNENIIYVYDGHDLKEISENSDYKRDRGDRLIRSEDGELWMISRNPRAIYFNADDQLVRHAVSDQFPGRVRDAYPQSDGNIWMIFFGVDGVWRYEKSKKEFSVYLSETRLQTFWNRYDGSLAALSGNKAYYLEQGSWTEKDFGFESRELTFQNGNLVKEDRNGTIWFSVRGGGFDLYQDSPLRKLVSTKAISNENIFNIQVGHNDDLWVDGFASIFRIRPVLFRNWTDIDSVNEAGIQQCFPGLNGDLWFSGPSELILYSNMSRTFQHISIPFPSGLRRIASLKNGDVLFAGGSAEFWRLRNGKYYRFEDIPSNVSRIYEHSDGTVYVVGVGWIKTLEGDRLKSVYESPQERSFVATSVREDDGGQLLIHTRQRGLFAFNDLELETVVPALEGEEMARDYVQIGNGKYLFTTRWLGILCYDNGEWRNLSDAFPQLGSNLWLIRSDYRGNLWISSDTGYHRYKESEIIDLVHGRLDVVHGLTFGVGDGLPSSTGFLQADNMYFSPEGDVWFCTRNGIAHTTTAKIDTQSKAAVKPSSSHITSVYIDDETSYPERGTIVPGSITLQPHQSRFEISYAAIGHQFPEKSEFSLRLAGLNEEWTDVGFRRQATYEYLPAGEFVFEVREKNSGDQVARLGIVVLPPWWATTWFKFVVVAFVSMMVAVLFYEMRRRNLERLSMQASFSRNLINLQEGERKRVARELHDGLGQELLVLKNRIDMEASQSEESAKPLEALSDRAKKIIQQVREISHDLSPPELERFGLKVALESMIDEVSEVSQIPVGKDIEDPQPRPDTTIEIAIYRIVQEALINVVKHSDASEAKVSLRQIDRSLILEVQDDGRGFAYRNQTGADVGLGLQSMGERAQLLGGRFYCQSEPGEGTHLRVTIPLREEA